MASYFIIGGDGKEYGPVSETELRGWIAENRVASQTKVRTEGTTEWRALADLPEMAGALKRTAPPSPIGAVAARPANGKGSALAIGSLVLGILGLFTCGATALFGLILGIIALVRISRSQGELRGHGTAVAGVVVSGIFLLLVPIFAAMLLPALAAAKQKAMQINCINNEKQLALAVIVYSNDHTNHLPSAATWCDAIKSTVGSDRVFKCPAAKADDRCDYAFNAKLDGLAQEKVDPQTVLIFEADGGWNAHGGADLLVTRHRRSMSVVAFADGHVEAVPEARLASLRWNP